MQFWLTFYYLIDAVDYANNKADYFARRLYSTIAGTGTDENALNRQILSRCEIDLENIKNEYEKIFLTTLRNAVAVLIYSNYLFKTISN